MENREPGRRVEWHQLPAQDGPNVAGKGVGQPHCSVQPGPSEGLAVGREDESSGGLGERVADTACGWVDQFQLVQLQLVLSLASKGLAIGGKRPRNYFDSGRALVGR